VINASVAKVTLSLALQIDEGTMKYYAETNYYASGLDLYNALAPVAINQLQTLIANT
jgi:hypothetical protein